MDIDSLINNAELNSEIQQLRNRIANPDHAISDVIDAAGNQYIDMVMEGGGMLGIALVGYSWALEEMGIRFFGVGGTSAGSINAILLAGLGTPAEAKSPRLLKALANLDFYRFVDGGKDVKKLIELATGPERRFKGLQLFYRFLRVKKQLGKHYGLNKGNEFLNWLTGLLAEARVKTLEDLHTQLIAEPAGLALRNGEPFGATVPRGKLVIITADITTETRVEFPRMADLYWEDPLSESPAQFARASMSIPVFFEPFRINNIPQGSQAKKNWLNMAGYDTENDPTAIIPETAMFVDGGIMSNFPIDAFHQHDKVPSMPTFGVKLEYDQRFKSPETFPVYGKGRIKNLFPLFGSVLNSARHTLDYEFIKRHPDYRHLVQYIPCTYVDDNGNQKSYNWLDFKMSEQHRKELFIQGAKKAIEFIKEFSGPVDINGNTADDGHIAFSSKWQFYKTLREKLKMTDNSRNRRSYQTNRDPALQS